MSDMRTTLGTIFKTERAALGMSQSQFGDHIGVTKQFVYCVEKGLCRPSFKVLERLAEKTGKQLKVSIE